MTEEEVPDEIEHVEQSSIHASDGEIEPVEHLPELMEECSFEDFMKLGSRSDKKVHEDKFILEHTHDLVPPQSAHYLRSHRRIESSQVGLINKMHSSGFKQSDIYSYMSNEAGENDDGTIGSYIVKELVGWKRIRKVAYNRLEHSVSCTCRKFEFHGILCSHALKVFRDLQHESLPPRYYLKRWTRTIVDEDVFDLHGDLIPNDNDPSLTIRYSALSQISQRIVSKSSKFPDVSALTKVGLLELDAKVDSWISSRCANENVASNTQTNSTLNLDDEAPLRDPTKRKRRQGNKRKRGALEGKQPKKKTSCKRKGKGEGSTTEAMIGASQPSQEVEENITLNESGMQYIGGQGYMGSFMCPNMNQGPHVEQQNVARRLQFQSHLMVEESIGDGGYEV
ncbi:hypothetical protein Vadar_000639 [Vaccinium darrowii]|uniref:Uncharacterized protein n=1 Tax=Vaccinium darrowii TaxID=229202 RepID=A0ACB7YIM3_9ERIC|nr:hypothetical protein Vadar_000639 [Vaccinium darrowii]